MDATNQLLPFFRSTRRRLLLASAVVAVLVGLVPSVSPLARASSAGAGLPVEFAPQCGWNPDDKVLQCAVQRSPDETDCQPTGGRCRS
jgi:hypothetical protein